MIYYQIVGMVLSMRHGFIKCAAGTPEIKVADSSHNADQIIALMKRAADEEVRLLVLPELCVTGYTCGDLFFQRRLLDSAVAALKKIALASIGMRMITIAGLPLAKNGSIYNCAAVIYQGNILGIVPKSNLPNYNEYYEWRNFSPAPAGNSVISIEGIDYPFGPKLLFTCSELQEFCFGVEICEDLWVGISPSSYHCKAGATIIANLSGSNEIVGKDDYRRSLVCGQSAKQFCGYVYANAGQGESTTDVVFAGHNIIAENGILLAESPLFSGELTISEIDVHRLEGERRKISTFIPDDTGYQKIYFDMTPKDAKLTRTFSKSPFVPAPGPERDRRCETVLSIQAMGLKARITHTNSSTVVLGVSGGLDSCLAILVCARAMDMLQRPRKDIIAVTMPGFGTTERTHGNAERLAENIGATLMQIGINDSVLQHFKDISHSPEEHNVVYENAQARERTQVLMDIANKYNGIVVGTGDLSELALGWATYNGDHMSMYGVNASVPKTLVRHLVGYYAGRSDNESLKAVLRDILDTPVSPELLPAENGQISQQTESIVGPYELHDFFLYYAIRWGFTPSKVLRIASLSFRGDYTDKEILHWLKTFYRRFFSQQYKRSCLPDGPKVGSVALSPRGDWRMPSDASASEWLAELNGISI